MPHACCTIFEREQNRVRLRMTPPLNGLLDNVIAVQDRDMLASPHFLAPAAKCASQYTLTFLCLVERLFRVSPHLRRDDPPRFPPSSCTTPLRSEVGPGLTSTFGFSVPLMTSKVPVPPSFFSFFQNFSWLAELTEALENHSDELLFPCL